MARWRNWSTQLSQKQCFGVWVRIPVGLLAIGITLCNSNDLEKKILNHSFFVKFFYPQDYFIFIIN